MHVKIIHKVAYLFPNIMSPVRSNKVNKETHMVNIQLGTMMVVLIGYTREKKRM